MHLLIGDRDMYNVRKGLVWFGFMTHQPLRVVDAKSTFKHINSFIPNNSVWYKYSCLFPRSWMKKQFYFKQFSWAQVRSLNVQAVLFQTIQFSISTQFSSIWPIDRTRSGANTLGQCGPRSKCSKGVLCIHQSTSITGTSPSDCLVSYPDHSFRESYPSAEKQSVYSIAPADWAIMIV